MMNIAMPRKKSRRGSRVPDLGIASEEAAGRCIVMDGSANVMRCYLVLFCCKGRPDLSGIGDHPQTFVCKRVNCAVSLSNSAPQERFGGIQATGA